MPGSVWDMKVIAHRGASGHRPEHTLTAYELALRLGADSVELDLVATKDGVVVCRHDLELSATTDVADRPELAHLRRRLVVDGVMTEGWFVHDLTHSELRMLRCRERWPRQRPGSAAYDGRYAVPTLAEALDLVDRESGRSGRRLEVHAELKSPRHLAGAGLWLPELLAGVATPGLTWMSFDAVALRRMRDGRPRVRLFDRKPTGVELTAAGRYAAAVGVRRGAVLPRDAAGGIGAPSSLVARARRRGLSVLVWTHRAENRHLPTSLRIGPDRHAHGHSLREAELLWDAGIAGLISDFPEIAAAARERTVLAAAQ